MQGLYEPSSLRNAEHREDPGKQNANEKEVVYSENFTLFSDGMKSPIPQILSLKNLTPVSPGLTGLQQPMPTSLTPGLHVTQENHGDSDKRFLQSGTLWQQSWKSGLFLVKSNVEHSAWNMVVHQ